MHLVRILSNLACADQEGGRGGAGVRTPLKNHKNIGLLCNTGPDPLKFSKVSKLPSQHSMFGHNGHASETPFGGIKILSPLKNVVRVGPPLTKLSGSAHAWVLHLTEVR